MAWHWVGKKLIGSGLVTAIVLTCECYRVDWTGLDIPCLSNTKKLTCFPLFFFPSLFISYLFLLSTIAAMNETIKWTHMMDLNLLVMNNLYIILHPPKKRSSWRRIVVLKSVRILIHKRGSYWAILYLFLYWLYLHYLNIAIVVTSLSSGIGGPWPTELVRLDFDAIVWWNELK